MRSCARKSFPDMSGQRVVILWAGCGRRISSQYGGMHKALIPLNGEPLLAHLLRTVAAAGATELIPVLGYRGDTLLSAIESYGGAFKTITPVFNPDYEHTNNLGSLLCGEEILRGTAFAVVNGDMVFDARILSDLFALDGNAVAADLNDYGTQLDSPRVLVKDGYVLDIGRHRTIQESQGYAVGIYKFGKSFSEEYFELGKKYLTVNPNAGYHDVLIGNLKRFPFKVSPVRKFSWMDVDEPDDVPKAEEKLKELQNDQ